MGMGEKASGRPFLMDCCDRSIIAWRAEESIWQAVDI